MPLRHRDRVTGIEGDPVQAVFALQERRPVGPRDSGAAGAQGEDLYRVAGFGQLIHADMALFGWEPDPGLRGDATSTREEQVDELVPFRRILLRAAQEPPLPASHFLQDPRRLGQHPGIPILFR